MTPPRAAVLLVGGLGTRMHPLTLTRPKHLLPVAGVPVIDLQLRRLADAGVRHVVFACRCTSQAGASRRSSTSWRPSSCGGA